MDGQPPEIEALLAQFLKPVKKLPFPVVIRALANTEVIALDRSDPVDIRLIEQLTQAAAEVGELVRANPIRRNRPNEVGNDIEPFVMAAVANAGLHAERPRSARGRGQQTGYPDILVRDADGRPTYVECKVFGEDNALTTMRSFYLSPSEHIKVSLDARHLLMAFAVARTPVADSQDSLYRATAFKLLDLHSLSCDVKYEFNSDNRRLYDAGMILAEGAI